MRYFTKELWSRINHHDEAVRAQAEKEWTNNALLYRKYFGEVQSYFPRRFMDEYLLRNGFHDYTVLGIYVTMADREYSCNIQLTNGLETVLCTMIGLKALQIDATSFQCCMLGKLAWGYSEFAITPENNLQVSVLCDLQNEMMFQFKSVRLTIRRHKGRFCGFSNAKRYK